MTWCIYCLAGQRRSSASLVEYRTENIIHKLPPMPVSELSKRLDAIGEKDPDVIFYLNGLAYAFLPVATWQGDAVCEAHLIERVSER